MMNPYVPNEFTEPYQEPVQNHTVQSPLPPDDTQQGFSQGPVVPQPVTPQPPRRSNGLRTASVFALTLVLAIVFGTGLFAGWQFGRTSTTTASPTATTGAPTVTIPAQTGSNQEAVREAVIAKVRPAVVQVNVVTQSGQGLGSGVIIDQRGYIVTNNHVVTGARQVEVVLYDGTRYPAQIVGTDAADDLAVIKINPRGTLTVATLGDSSQLQVGQDVLAIGNPLGITQTVTKGIISALSRNVSEGQNGATIPDAIQTDAPINPGNSGGALVDMQGQVIGIPTLAAIDPEFNTPASGVGFAIPSNRVKFIVPQIIQTGKVTHTGRAILGVRVTTVDEALAAQHNLAVDHGVYIVSVTSGGPAAQGGLRPGDVIVGIDSQAVNDTSALGDVLLAKNPGDTVAVQVYRGNQQLTLNVKLGELQA